MRCWLRAASPTSSSPEGEVVAASNDISPDRLPAGGVGNVRHCKDIRIGGLGSASTGCQAISTSPEHEHVLGARFEERKSQLSSYSTSFGRGGVEMVRPDARLGNTVLGTGYSHLQHQSQVTVV